jgi:hypothetical protein
MDVGAWLRSLGLERYEAAFRENEIDETVLSSLTHETLKELGVSAVGPRLKLLDAMPCNRHKMLTCAEPFYRGSRLAAGDQHRLCASKKTMCSEPSDYLRRHERS